MAGSQATISDVTEVITTGLDTSSGGPIDDSLNYAKELNQEYNDESNQTATQTKNIERWAAVLNIRQYKERGVEEDAVADSSAVYEGDEIKRAKTQLKEWIKRAGGDTRMVADVNRDTNRRTGTMTPNK